MASKTAKRIFIGAIAALAIAAIAILLIRKYVKSYSFAPESLEQAYFAQQHAECAAVYLTLRTAARKLDSPRYRELEKDYQSEYEHHVKMGFNFSPDKDLYKSSIEAAHADFAHAMSAAKNQAEVTELIDSRVNRCVELVFQSGRFVMDTLKERAGN